MPTPEKEYYQKKLTAGTGITISPSNVISAVSTGSYMNSTNPAGIGRLSMNRYQPSEFSTTVSYSEGDYVSYEGVTYVATTAVAAGSDFDSSQWDVIMLEGAYSNTLGYDNIAIGGYQTVRGKYNEPSYSYVDIVGWGTDDANRANIQTLDSAGNLWVAGRVSASPPISSSDLVTKNWLESTYSSQFSGSGLATPTTASGEDGYLYTQYSVDVATSATTVDKIYTKINGEWCEIVTGGSGSVNYYGTGLPTTAIGENGSLYMQYSVDVSTSESSIDNIYGKINDEWLEIETGSQITVDSVLSTVSTNPVENRVITNAVGDVEEALIAINGASFEDTIAALDAINGEVI